jgi:hypothetical protein
MSGAREAVARILRERYPLHSNGFNDETADDVLTRLRPIIAAEIRAWANGEFEAYDRADMDRFDAIASRICGEGEQ